MKQAFLVTYLFLLSTLCMSQTLEVKDIEYATCKGKSLSKGDVVSIHDTIDVKLGSISLQNEKTCFGLKEGVHLLWPIYLKEKKFDSLTRFFESKLLVQPEIRISCMPLSSKQDFIVLNEARKDYFTTDTHRYECNNDTVDIRWHLPPNDEYKGVYYIIIQDMGESILDIIKTNQLSYTLYLNKYVRKVSKEDAYAFLLVIAKENGQGTERVPIVRKE